MLELIPGGDKSSDEVSFLPGDYLQIEIPSYEEIRYRDLDIPEPFASVWRNQHLFDLVASNPEVGRRNNYSLACNRQTEKGLRLNVRIATPPQVRTALPALAPATSLALKKGTWSRPSDLSGIFISGRPSVKCCTSVAARAWPRCVLIFRTCSKPSRRLARSVFGMARDQSRDILRGLLPVPGEDLSQLLL